MSVEKDWRLKEANNFRLTCLLFKEQRSKCYYNKQMLKSLSKKIAIDLGSAQIKLLVVDELKTDVWDLSPLDFKNKVIIADACIARRKDNHKLLAIGGEALAMRGRLDSLVEIVFPFQQSRIMDQEAAHLLLKELFKKILNGLVLNPSIMVVSKANATPLTRQLLSQLFYDLGFARVDLIAEPLAAAIGGGVPVADSSGTLFLQMGASEVSINMISLGSILFSQSSDWGAHYLNTKIIDHLALNENLAISWDSAELLKRQVFALQKSSRSLSVTGKTISGANPLELSIKSSDLAAIAKLLKIEYQALFDSLLAQLPPDLMADVLQKGLLLSGGLAQLNGLEAFFSQQFALPVALLAEPDLLAIMGAAAMVKNIDLFSNSLSFDF